LHLGRHPAHLAADPFSYRLLSEFEKNPPVQSHVLRHIQIIGEAVSRLSAELKEQDNKPEFGISICNRSSPNPS